MNTENTFSPDELEVNEVRILAVLLGEASAAETAAVEILVAAHPQLQALRARLSLTIGLLRDTARVRTNEKAPAQLSPERREALLAVLSKKSATVSERSVGVSPAVSESLPAKPRKSVSFRQVLLHPYVGWAGLAACLVLGFAGVGSAVRMNTSGTFSAPENAPASYRGERDEAYFTDAKVQNSSGLAASEPQTVTASAASTAVLEKSLWQSTRSDTEGKKYWDFDGDGRVALDAIKNRESTSNRSESNFALNDTRFGSEGRGIGGGFATGGAIVPNPTSEVNDPVRQRIVVPESSLAQDQRASTTSSPALPQGNVEGVVVSSRSTRGLGPPPSASPAPAPSARPAAVASDLQPKSEIGQSSGGGGRPPKVAIKIDGPSAAYSGMTVGNLNATPAKSNSLGLPGRGSGRGLSDADGDGQGPGSGYGIAGGAAAPARPGAAAKSDQALTKSGTGTLTISGTVSGLSVAVPENKPQTVITAGTLLPAEPVSSSVASTPPPPPAPVTINGGTATLEFASKASASPSDRPTSGSVFYRNSDVAKSEPSSNAEAKTKTPAPAKPSAKRNEAKNGAVAGVDYLDGAAQVGAKREDSLHRQSESVDAFSAPAAGETSVTGAYALSVESEQKGAAAQAGEREVPQRQTMRGRAGVEGLKQSERLQSPQKDLPADGSDRGAVDANSFFARGIADARAGDDWYENGKGKEGTESTLTGERFDDQSEFKKELADKKASREDESVLANELVPTLEAIPALGRQFAGEKGEKQVEELTKLKRNVTLANTIVPEDISRPLATLENAFSTFALNVSDASFRLTRDALNQGTWDATKIRSEEFYNAFQYRDPAPQTPIGLTQETAAHPFTPGQMLVRLGVQTQAQGRAPQQPLHLTVLLDNSGSMERTDRREAALAALRGLAQNLGPQDTISLVSFSATPRLWLDHIPGNQAAQVAETAAQFPAEGGTNLEAALEAGYEQAEKQLSPGSKSAVILLTDGSANLGNADANSLADLVAANRQRGIAFHAYGVGSSDLNDATLERLARNGDGRYAVLSTPEEAEAQMVGPLAGSFRPAALDVKVQVEWNSRRVKAHRLVGFAERRLTKEQFRDNTVDGGELAAAASGNALYSVETIPDGDGPLGTVRVRYRDPATDSYRELSWPVAYDSGASSFGEAPRGLRLAGVAALLAERLQGQPAAQDTVLADLRKIADQLAGEDTGDAAVPALAEMVRQAEALLNSR